MARSELRCDTSAHLGGSSMGTVIEQINARLATRDHWQVNQQRVGWPHKLSPGDPLRSAASMQDIFRRRTLRSAAINRPDTVAA